MYVLSGWEGSVHDSKLLIDALTRMRTALKVLQGKYFLVDCGFPNICQFLAPFRGVRHHLQEFGGQGRDPANEVELFNLCHASLRNVIEINEVDLEPVNEVDHEPVFQTQEQQRTEANEWRHVIDLNMWMDARHSDNNKNQ
ncbi:hypothetical protein Ddye_013243 [Dipteronia dyeriana]|uniref:DDE Tnp4 domain-containing protein n=1 Tax=Dipteronia dyeriana TaxID=168575 RepID=A0AAD9X632_9ROSI|nr:hypothetical protein Ddye_013243 [Dipteronia dyeriana]